ncbi:MAG TPA: hypothetical protein VI456_16910 [Polyangia bacterium]
MAPMLSVLLVPACYSLPKVDVIRVVDDFADGGPDPTWSAFEPWTCGLDVDPGQASDAGRDGGLDGGAEAGQAVSCDLTRGPGDDMDDTPLPTGVGTHSLVAIFNLTAPTGVEVTTRTAMSDGGTQTLSPSIPVDLTAFSELRFNAKLVDTTPGTAAQLPTGTGLSVELHCSYSSMNSPVSALLTVDEKIVDLTLGVKTFQPIALAFSKFTGTSQRQTCLANVNSISFHVVLGTAQAGTRVAGTLQLDDIRFDNAPPQ